ncbi:MAG: hypothetical protein ACRCTP_03695 [Aeromonas popoffii]|uniref:hypothetical protein n=1 Tax=Aeromonas popoffii TaxID=70856 RepID=UPI003F39E1D1
MKAIIFAVVVAALLILTGCSDAARSKMTNRFVGEEASVKCYSGDKLIYDGVSTGKILTEQSSDGYYFREKVSGDLVEVSGNCVIRY